MTLDSVCTAGGRASPLKSATACDKCRSNARTENVKEAGACAKARNSWSFRDASRRRKELSELDQSCPQDRQTDDQAHTHTHR